MMNNVRPYSVAPNSRGEWCDWDDLTEAERAAWIRGQRAADEEWERRRHGVTIPTLRQELIERESAELLRHN